MAERLQQVQDLLCVNTHDGSIRFGMLCSTNNLSSSCCFDQVKHIQIGKIYQQSMNQTFAHTSHPAPWQIFCYFLLFWHFYAQNLSEEYRIKTCSTEHILILSRHFYSTSCFARTETHISFWNRNLEVVSLNLGDCCAKCGVMRVDLSHSTNRQGEKTFSLSDMPSARSVPRPVRCHSASAKEMAEMIIGWHWKVWTTSFGTHALSARKKVTAVAWEWQTY